jgi:hypothetical protein
MTLTGKSHTHILHFILFFFVLLLVPPSFYHQPGEGIDSSWNIALHLAYKYHLVFGKDFVFTYGPLGILNSRHPITVSLFVYLIFDLYFLTTMFFVLRKIFREHFSPGIILFSFLSIVLTMYNSADEWCYFLFAFYIFYFIKDPSEPVCLIQAAIFSILGFYLKISLGMIGVSLFLMAISYALIRKKINVKYYFLAVASFILSLWLSAKWLNVNLKGYISSSLQFINDYNDSMFTALGAADRIYLYASWFFIGTVVFWAGYRFIISIREKKLSQNLDELFVYAVVGFSIFILFKSAFVRTEGHLPVFFRSASLFIIFLYLYRPVNAGKKITAMGCWLSLIISFVAVSTIPGNYHPYVRLANLSFFPNKAGEIKRYVAQIFRYNQAVSASDSLDSSHNELKEIIGNNTVDIIPSEISKIYFNGLRYNPRPVVQSYAAYDSYLDSLNCQKYTSPDGPDYVLLTAGTIDDRYSFFDESRTKLALFNNYRITGELHGDLILKKNSTIHGLPKPQNTETANIKFGEDIQVKRTADLQYVKFLVDYSLWGKIRRFFFQPPALMVTFTLDNGDTKTFRAIKPILADGVITNKYVESEQDLQILLQSNGLSSTNIKKIRIGPDDRHNGFRDNITIVSMYYPFSSKTDSERIADSISLSALEGKYKPVLLDSSIVRQDSVLYGIRDFNTYSPIIKVRGWAFRENANNKNAVVKAILQSKDRIYELQSQKEERQDLPLHFKREDIVNMGFTSNVSKSQIESGDYQLGVAVSFEDSSKKWVHYVPDAHVLIRSHYNIEQLKSIDSNALGNNDLQFDIGTIEENQDQFVVDGWAFIRNTDTRGAKINLILQGKGMIYKINTDIINRSDLISYFKNPLLGYGGFSVIIPKSKLPEGTYSVGVEVICCDGKKQSVQFGAKKIKIDAQ